jgi:hypothetical protein
MPDPKGAASSAAESTGETTTAADTTTVETVVAPATDANPAGSSNADVKDANTGDDAGSDAKPKSILDAVRAAVSKTAEPAADTAADGASSDTDDGKAKSASDATAAKADDDEDESKPPPFHEHPRWKKLYADYEAARGPAEQYAKIEDFRTKNGLSVDDVVAGFRIMALVRNDPEKALAELEAQSDRIREAIGKKLPTDLQDAVEQGTISEDHAAELARARAANRSLASEVEDTRTRETERQAIERRDSIVNAVKDWSAKAAETDPDFAVKEPLVKDRVLRIARAEGQPRTPAEGVKLAMRAYDEITQETRRFAPKPRQMDPNPQGGRSSATTKPPPKTMKDAIRASVNAA